MKPQKPMAPIAERSASIVSLGLVWLALFGCSRTELNEDDSQGPPDTPADLPSESVEYEGILYGLNFNAEPTRFEECESGEVFHLYWSNWTFVLEGSCYGVYSRIRGQLNRSLDPPGLLIEETLEARWSKPSDCLPENYVEPDYASCNAEEHPDQEAFLPPCAPALYDDCGGGRCSPERFDATEVAGWKQFDCNDQPGMAGPKQKCEYSGDFDNCMESFRCWNPEGDITEPGICVSYCDLEEKLGVECLGTCVRCSSSDRWGLCMTDCSGDDCNIDAFC